MTSDQPWWLTWPVAEVAVAILPLFSSCTRQQASSLPRAIVDWCKTGTYRGADIVLENDLARTLENPDELAVAEAIQLLQQERLLIQIWGRDRSYVGLTRLGRHALQTNTVRQHLGLSDPPTN